MARIINDDCGVLVGIQVGDEIYDADDIEDLVRERDKIGQSYVEAMRCARSLYNILTQEGFDLPNHRRRFPWLLIEEGTDG